MNEKRGSGPQPSGYDLAENSLRAHLEATIGVIDEGSPRMFARVHLYAMRKILDEAQHLVQRDGTVNAVIPDYKPADG